MNENLNLVEILKDCPSGTYLWCDIWGEVQLLGLVAPDNSDKITIRDDRCFHHELYCYGNVDKDYPQCCVLWPSKENKDWSIFKVKKPKFDPKTLNPFDKVLLKGDKVDCVWKCSLHSHLDTSGRFSYCVNTGVYKMCVPYNEDTKHLVGTTEKAPEFYRYWED